ncbi:hypothetical protein Tco_0584150 [Tanacetum coccineum]
MRASTPSKFEKSLTCGASISWGRSRLHKGTNTYSWPSTICQNGLKRKRSLPMMPEVSLQILKLSSPDLVLPNMEFYSPSLPRLSPTNKWGKWKYQIVALKEYLERTIGKTVPPGRDKLDDAPYGPSAQLTKHPSGNSYKL